MVKCCFSVRLDYCKRSDLQCKICKLYPKNVFKYTSVVISLLKSTEEHTRKWYGDIFAY